MTKELLGIVEDEGWSKLKKARFFHKLANSGIDPDDYKLAIRSHRDAPLSTLDIKQIKSNQPLKSNAKNFTHTAEELKKWIPIQANEKLINRVTPIPKPEDLKKYFNKTVMSERRRVITPDKLNKSLLQKKIRKRNNDKQVQSKTINDSLENTRKLANFRKICNLNNTAKKETMVVNKRVSPIKSSMVAIPLQTALDNVKKKIKQRKFCVTPNKVCSNDKSKKISNNNELDNKSLLLNKAKTIIKEIGKTMTSEKKGNKIINKQIVCKSKSPLKKHQTKVNYEEKSLIYKIVEQKVNNTVKYINKYKQRKHE